MNRPAKITLDMAIKDAATFIAELYESLKNPHVGEEPLGISSERFRIASQFYVVGDTVGKLNDLEETIYESVRSDGFISPTAAEWLLHKAMTEAITTKDGLIGEREFQPALTKALAELKRCLRETPSDWEYWIRVVGFADEGFPSSFGQASFRMMNEADVNDLAGRIERAIDRTIISDEQKEAMKSRMSSSVRRTYFGHVTATLAVSAVDSDAGADSALKVLRLTLDVLNFFISWDHPPTRGIRLLWEGGGIPEQFLAFKKTPPEGFTLKGPLKGLVMAATVKPFENTPFFRRASELLAKQQPNAFEKRVLSALQWAGRASVQERPDQALLFYVISLENLLLGSNRDSELGYRFRVRGAHVLGLDLDSRKDIQRQLKDLYALRSTIVHSGSAQIRESDISLIQYFAKEATGFVLTDDAFRDMVTEQDLEKYFDAKVLQ